MGVSKKTIIVSKISKLIGFNRICYFLNRNRKRVIAYHNVIPDEHFDKSLQSVFSIKKSSLKKHIEVMNKNFDIGIDYLDPKQVTLTFDDGYLNQYAIASKLLDEYNVKGYFFCAADLIESCETLDIDKMTYWFSYVPYGRYDLEEYNECLEIYSENDRGLKWDKIQSLIDKNVPTYNIVKNLDKLYKFEDITINEELYNLRFKAIDKISLDKMKMNGHKIGAHSASHRPLSYMTKDDLKLDILKCKNMLGEYYNTRVFCYPFGSPNEVNDNVIEEVKSNRFECAFSFGFYKKGKHYERFFMPRMELPDTDDEYVIDFMLSGAMQLIKYGRLFPKIV